MGLMDIKYIFILVAISIGNQVFSQTENIVLNNAKLFIDTPYKAGTLDINKCESLVVNLEEVDCTTFVEYVLAMTLANSQTKSPNDSLFLNCLLRIRYRDGIIDGYPSRLHYISDWINNGVKHQIIEDITSQQCPATTTLSLSYMSSNPHHYLQLKSSPQDIVKMKAVEETLNNKEVCWLPTDSIPLHGLSYIENGDILAITTNIKGLDVAHIGFAFYNSSNELCLLHASSKHKKVLIDSQPLNALLRNNSKWTGVRVLRMMNQEL